MRSLQKHPGRPDPTTPHHRHGHCGGSRTADTALVRHARGGRGWLPLASTAVNQQQASQKRQNLPHDPPPFRSAGSPLGLPGPADATGFQRTSAEGHRTARQDHAQLGACHAPGRLDRDERRLSKAADSSAPAAARPTSTVAVPADVATVPLIRNGPGETAPDTRITHRKYPPVVEASNPSREVVQMGPSTTLPP